MRLSVCVTLVCISTVAAGWAAYASYLEGHESPPGAETIEEHVVPPPPHVPDNPLTDLVRRVRVGPGYSYQGLTVFPVELDRVVDRTDYLSMEEAIRRRDLVITEKETGSVPILLAQNRGRRPVLVLAGEIVVGGKQNRTLQDDVLLPPGSGLVELPVYCVERGRWHGTRMEFGTNATLMGQNARAAAIQHSDGQAAVWENIAAYSDVAAAIASPTEDLEAMQASEQVQQELARYREEFEKCWRPETVGMVVAEGYRFVGADVFCNERLFRRHRDRLLDSYAFDCVVIRLGKDDAEMLRAPTPSTHDAVRFLNRVLAGEFTWRGTPGQGRLLEVTEGDMSGTALVLEDVLLHACLMVLEHPPVRPMPIEIQPMQQEPEPR
jgi:hypothetical protein